MSWFFYCRAGITYKMYKGGCLSGSGMDEPANRAGDGGGGGGGGGAASITEVPTASENERVAGQPAPPPHGTLRPNPLAFRSPQYFTPWPICSGNARPSDRVATRADARLAGAGDVFELGIDAHAGRMSARGQTGRANALEPLRFSASAAPLPLIRPAGPRSEIGSRRALSSNRGRGEGAALNRGARPGMAAGVSRSVAEVAAHPPDRGPPQGTLRARGGARARTGAARRGGGRLSPALGPRPPLRGARTTRRPAVLPVRPTRTSAPAKATARRRGVSGSGRGAKRRPGIPRSGAPKPRVHAAPPKSSKAKTGARGHPGFDEARAGIGGARVHATRAGCDHRGARRPLGPRPAAGMRGRGGEKRGFKPPKTGHKTGIRPAYTTRHRGLRGVQP